MSSGSPAVGICARDLPDPPGQLAHVAAQAAALGVDAVQLSSLLDLSPTLDPGQLTDAAATFESHGLRVWAGLGDIGRYHPGRAGDLLAAGGGDPLAGAERLLNAAADLGIHWLAVTLGREEDRFQPEWSDQLRATTAWLHELTPLLADTASTLVIKTHEELTTHELMSVLATLDPSTFAVGFDPTNSVVRMEPPVDALARVSGHVHTVHLDDVYLCRDSMGLVRRPAPLGAGCLQWTTLLPVALQPVTATPPPARLLVDLHRADLRMPYRTAGWTSYHPDLIPTAITRMTNLSTASLPTDPSIDQRRHAALDWLAPWLTAPAAQETRLSAMCSPPPSEHTYVSTPSQHRAPRSFRQAPNRTDDASTVSPSSFPTDLA